MQFEIVEINTGLPLLLSPAQGTPRMALAVVMHGGTLREEQAGVARLASRLLMKGTASRSAETLAREVEERGIDLREVTLPDCALLLAVFLNRELPTVLTLLADILFHSTFVDFQKEAVRLAGEIQSSLDQPAEQAQDLLGRLLFADFPYGNTGRRVLEALPTLTEDQIRAWHFDGLNPRRMNVALVGDFDTDAVRPLLEATFADLVDMPPGAAAPVLTGIARDRVATEARTEAQQAQLYQGWYAPPMGAPEQAAVAVMNTILGGAGMSSRLFTELRDKQGLAYSVRSSYLPMGVVGELQLSIGTSPENIDRARRGFADQLARLQQEPVTAQELQQATGRLHGSYVLSHETNRQQCLDMALNHIQGLGPDYSETLLQHIDGVTIAEVQTAAQLFSSPSATAIVARDAALVGIVTTE